MKHNLFDVIECVPFTENRGKSESMEGSTAASDNLGDTFSELGGLRGSII